MTQVTLKVAVDKTYFGKKFNNGSQLYFQVESIKKLTSMHAHLLKDD